MYGPLMTPSRDNIVKASLLKPTREEHGTSSTLEEETVLLGKEIKLPQVPGSFPEWPEIPEFIEPAMQITTPSASSPSPMPQPSHLHSGKAKKSWQGMEGNPNNHGRWVCFYLQEHDRVWEWWREFQSLLCSMDKCLGNIHIQGLACQQAADFRLPATQLEKDGSWTAPSCLVVLGQRDYFPLRISRELGIIKRCGVKKWWHWPWHSRDAPLVPECTQGCTVGQCKSSMNTSPPW